MRDENKEILEKYRDRLRTAFYEDWARNIPANGLEALKKAYEEESGIRYQGNISLGCAHCQLQLLKVIARWYFNQSETLEETELVPQTDSEIKEPGRRRNRRKLTSK